MASRAAVTTKYTPRSQLASWLPNHRAIKTFEDLTSDVSVVLPDATLAAATSAEAAAVAAAAAQTAADTAQATAAAAQASALAAAAQAALALATAKVQIGGIHITIDPTDPATALGYGTWAAFAQGRVIVGVDPTDPDFSTVEQTGGTKTQTF